MLVDGTVAVAVHGIFDHVFDDFPHRFSYGVFDCFFDFIGVEFHRLAVSDHLPEGFLQDGSDGGVLSRSHPSLS